MSSSRSSSPTPSSPRAGTPCTENGENQSMTPLTADAAGYTRSGSSISCYSRAPTPQCLPLDDQIPELEPLSQDMINQCVEIAQSIVEAQSRAATPCLSPNDLKTPEWPLEPYTIASGFALDELPDSDLWYRPEYQLTQEWLEQTLKYLKDIDDEKQVAAEREVDMRTEENGDIETEAVAEPRAAKRRRKSDS